MTEPFVTVTTVHDEGAAAVAEEMLTEAGIAVELRRSAGDAYFGGGPRVELRVPAGDVARAEQLLEILQTEVGGRAPAPDPTQPPNPAPTGDRRGGVFIIVFLVFLAFIVYLLRG